MKPVVLVVIAAAAIAGFVAWKKANEETPEQYAARANLDGVDAGGAEL
jgi:hypothetical protein